MYVSPSQIRRFHLRTGDVVLGQVRPPKENERYYALLKVMAVNWRDPEQAMRRPSFDDLTPIYPNERIRLEVEGQKDVATRLIDIIAPLGKGQRGLIVAPPKAGKTTVLKKIANSISTNHPEIDLIVLLIDERPEEVTDMERSVDGDVVAPPSTSRRKTTCAWPSWCWSGPSAWWSTAGMWSFCWTASPAWPARTTWWCRQRAHAVRRRGPASLHRPKRFFGAARNIEEGGSLTIIATALVETGSRMDDVIYEEFKGTGNWSCIWTAGWPSGASSRPSTFTSRAPARKSCCSPRQELETMFILRKLLGSLGTAETTDLLIERLTNTANNAEFIELVLHSPFAEEARTSK